MTPIVQPGSTIGIFGGGQLGKMLCIAASELGYKTCVYSDQADGCAFDVASKKIIAPYSDECAILQFVQMVHVITLEFENIPLSTIDLVSRLSNNMLSVFPGSRALEVSQDRRFEKKLARSLGIATPEFWIIENRDDVDQKIHYPVILKTARNGYDGKGQKRVLNKSELAIAWDAFRHVPCVAEEIIDFLYEFSVILVRNESGRINHYPFFENTHSDGILAKTEWPLRKMTMEEDERVSRSAKNIASALEVVGLLAVEMFYAKDGRILFNEIAPRPHNSGHITLDCAFTSQFEQHVRAICNLPLGNMGVKMPGHMVNIIGDLSLLPRAWNTPNAKIHLYGKAERKGRKLGHINYID